MNLNIQKSVNEWDNEETTENVAMNVMRYENDIRKHNWID